MSSCSGRPGNPEPNLLMKFRSLALLVILFVTVNATRATVFLSSYSFAPNNLPYIYSNDSFDTPYKLRAKIWPNYHATDGWNNNWNQLWSVPGPGTYNVELYYVKYDWDYYTILEVGQKVLQTITVQSASNSPPTIQWSSNPATAQAGQGYYIQATGSDANGNLTQVNVTKSHSPFAYAGGGNGFNGTSGNWTSDSGGQYVLYQAEAVDSNGARSGWISHWIYVNAKPTIWWEIAPPTVPYQTWYTIRARAQDVDANMSTINIYRIRNGAEEPFAFALNGSGGDAYSENLDYCSAYGSVTYRAEAFDAAGGSSGSIFVTVYTQNAVPAAGWSSTMPNTSVLAGGAVRFDTFIGQTYHFSVNGVDPDNNLQHVRTYQYAWENVNGSDVLRQDYVHFDTVTSGGPSVSRSYAHVGGKPWKWHYHYVAIARDTAGAEDPPVADNNLWVYLDNRTPAPPTLVSGQSSIIVGQQITLSGAGSDADQNATRQWLWYRHESSPEWLELTTSSYASGTGNTVINFTFMPAVPGRYYFKTRVEDPYAFNEIVDVAAVNVTPDATPPNPPTNLAVNGVTPTWANLGWSVSTSTDVVEQHIYWQPTSGGMLTDIMLGKNVEGASVTNLTAGGSFRMYLKARDGSGNYSASSNEVTVQTPVPPTVTSGPQSQTLHVGQTATFTVTASGSQPMTYLWRKDGVNLADGGNISGSTSQTLTVTNVQGSSAGTYTVVVSNNGGSVISGGALLAVHTPPIISAHPVSRTITVGQSVSFSVTASGSGTLAYQWMKNGATLSGATGSTYAISNVQTTHAANTPGYTVVVSNAVGSTTSAAATLAVATTPPIRLALQYWRAGDYPNRSEGGEWTYFEGWHDGDCHEVGEDTDGDGEDDSWHTECDDPWYGWGWGWREIYHEDGFYGSRWDTTVGTYGNPLFTDTGAYQAAATNRGYLLNDYPITGQGVTMRAWAYAPAGNCNDFLALVYNPGGALIASGWLGNGGYANLQFYDSWYGAGVFRIELRYNNAAGATPTTGSVNYYVAVGVPRPPTIITHPGPPAQTVNVGANISYSVSASGASSYQWYKDGTAINSANAATLSLTNVAIAAAGIYRVGAINGTGETLSLPVSLAVTDPGAADDDNDGIPNAIEQLLMTNPQSAGASDGANGTVQLKIHRP